MRGKQIVDAYQDMFLLYAHSLFFCAYFERERQAENLYKN